MILMFYVRDLKIGDVIQNNSNDRCWCVINISEISKFSHFGNICIDYLWLDIGWFQKGWQTSQNEPLENCVRVCQGTQ